MAKVVELQYNLPMRCMVCGIELTARTGAQTCSNRCRVRLHRAKQPPKVMTDRDRWVVHRADKAPRRLNGSLASSTDPASWSSFADASAVAAVNPVGLGFVLNGDGIACIDLDHCLTDGVLDSWAAKFLVNVPRTFVEVSPSGNGLHVWGFGVVGAGRRRGNLEMYDRGRYITVTGRVWNAAPRRLLSIQSLIDDVVWGSGYVDSAQVVA